MESTCRPARFIYRHVSKSYRFLYSKNYQYCRPYISSW